MSDREVRFEDYAFEMRPLSAEEGGGFLVMFPDLPGCMSDGETYEEAIANARAAFMDWMETHREEGREIPVPGGMGKPAKLVLRLPRTLHQQVSMTASKEGVSTNTLIATYVAQGIARREIPEGAAGWRVEERAGTYLVGSAKRGHGAARTRTHKTDPAADRASPANRRRKKL